MNNDNLAKNGSVYSWAFTDEERAKPELRWDLRIKHLNSDVEERYNGIVLSFYAMSRLEAYDPDKLKIRTDYSDTSITLAAINGIEVRDWFDSGIRLSGINGKNKQYDEEVLWFLTVSKVYNEEEKGIVIED